LRIISQKNYDPIDYYNVVKLFKKKKNQKSIGKKKNQRKKEKKKLSLSFSLIVTKKQWQPNPPSKLGKKKFHKNKTYSFYVLFMFLFL